jgi:hypothetical protein
METAVNEPVILHFLPPQIERSLRSLPEDDADRRAIAPPLDFFSLFYNSRLTEKLESR